MDRQNATEARVAEGFLARWSQRKQSVRAGQAPADPVLPAVRSDHTASEPSAQGSSAACVAGADSSLPVPTMDDVRALTPASDFKPFVDPQVGTDVRNAAMKKLFADPRFNVMDRLDTYIDDYSLPDPLPMSALREMVSARFLQLFEDADPANATGTSSEGTGNAAKAQPGTTEPPDDHTDL